MSPAGPLTTHVLDTARGRPAVGVPITLELQTRPDVFEVIASGQTNADGRLPGLLAPGALRIGIYRMTFDITTYEKGNGELGFYPYAQIVFRVMALDTHYHVPLLISGYGYSTYRGS